MRESHALEQANSLPAQHPETVEHWPQETVTAVDPLMFDTAVSQMEPWFKDTNAAASLRDVLFPEWNPDKALLYLEALLKYAEIRKTLPSHYPTRAAHNKARIEALNTFNRLSAEEEDEEE